jgi:type VI protein secretion system component Hcp
MGIFLKLDKIESDATDKNHKGWIACESYTAGSSRGVMTKNGAAMQRRADGAKLREVTLRMKAHKGSPKVFLASVFGPAQKATIHVTRSADTTGTDNFLSVELSDVYVSSYAVEYNGDVPWETVTLNYTEIKKVYKLSKSDGAAGANTPVGFSSATGKEP